MTRNVSRGQSVAQFGIGEIDDGLRRYVLQVYLLMTGALCVSGAVAYLAVSTGLYQQIASTWLIWVVMLAPLAAVLFLSFRIDRMATGTAHAVFWIYAAVMGLSLAEIFLVYTDTSIALTFFVSAATFGVMTVYGLATGRDLTRFGSFLFMGLVGIVIASIVNLFLASGPLQFAISVIGVLVFIGLTAADAQRIKRIYLESDGEDAQSRMAIMGALTLYLDFINLFVNLLQLTGDRRQ